MADVDVVDAAEAVAVAANGTASSEAGGLPRVQATPVGRPPVPRQGTPDSRNLAALAVVPMVLV